MSDKSGKGAKVAYCDEVDDGTGRRINGTRTYARADGSESPTKTSPSSKKPDTEPANAQRAASASKRASYIADSDSATSSSKGARLVSEPQRPRDPASQPRRSSQPQDGATERRVPSDRSDRRPRDPREPPAERPSRDPSAAPRRKSSTRQTRPPIPEHANTMHTVPQVKQARRISAEYHAGYTTLQPAVPPTRSRSRSRPNSFINMAPGTGPSPYPPNAYARPPQPPPPQQAAPGYPYAYPPGPIPAHSPIGPSPSSYYNVSPMDSPSDHLSRRFEGGSAIPPPDHSPVGYGPDPYRPKVVRRPSESARRHEIERQMMPPPDRIPQRTASAVPSHPALRAPPPGPHPVPRQSRSRAPSHHRRSVDFTPLDDDFHYNEYTAARDAPSRQSNHVIEVSRPGRRSTVYEPVEVQPAGRRSRRSSMYGAPMSHYREAPSYERNYADHRYDEAMAYQHEVNGGYQQPLTAEALQQMRHNVPSSRSTRSSGSRDDSDYRRSHSTALTGASSIGPTPEGMTVEIKGNGSVHIDRDGGVHISHPNGGSSRLSSDRGGTYNQLEDARGRTERKSLPYRPRTQSRTDSYGRDYSQWI